MIGVVVAVDHCDCALAQLRADARQWADGVWGIIQ